MRNVKIYSIGASNEMHGPALPINIDDCVAKRTAVSVSERIGADYMGHFPYSGDRVGAIARNWNPGYMDAEDVIKGIISDLKKDTSGCKELSHVIIISGHGGNNFIKKHEERISEATGVPTLYVPPFPSVFVKHPKYGEIVVSHADDAEHSIAYFMGLLNMTKFRMMNKVIEKNPMQALKEWPELMGLAGYANKYEILKQLNPNFSKNLKEFIKRKIIIADREVGRKLLEENIKAAESMIREFAGI